MGLPPIHMIEASPKAKKYFNKRIDETGTKIIYELKTPKDSKRPPKRDLAEILGVTTGGPGGRRLGEAGHSVMDYLKFKDLLEKMLQFDPTKRITSVTALQHSFFVHHVQNEDIKLSWTPSFAQTERKIRSPAGPLKPPPTDTVPATVVAVPPTITVNENSEPSGDASMDVVTTEVGVQTNLH